VRGRLTRARAWLATARERARHREPHPWQRLQLALDCEITTLLEPEVGVPLLEDLIRTTELDRERSRAGGRPADVSVHEPTSTDGLAVSLAVLSSGMLRLGQVDRAEALARRAQEVVTAQGQVHLSTVEEVEDARHQAELALGLPGAITARACMVELRAELARYREDWVRAIQDRLHHALADRELTLVEHQTLIDPLTGLHN